MSLVEMKYSELFDKIFGVSMFDYRDEQLAEFKLYNFDIVKFDGFLHDKKGYDEDKDGSMRDFIMKKYGAEAVAIMEEILDYTGLTNSCDEC